MIHVVPPMGPPNFIKESEISDHQGWVDISPYTLQHVQYKIFWTWRLYQFTYL